MEQKQIRVKSQQLTPGMKILAVTRLSSEYSYLDSKRVEFLKKKFTGAKATAVRDKGEEIIPIESLAPGDNITRIRELPPNLGFNSLDTQMVSLLQESGFMEFVAMESQEPPAQTTPQAAQKPTAPSMPKFKSAGGMNHVRRVAETKFLLEKLETAENERTYSANLVADLFQQGRANKYNVQPASEAVDRILRSEASMAMSAVSGLKSSDQTYAHCVDMAVLFNEAAAGIIRASGKQSTEKVSRSTMTAGFMHDIGKSKIPKDILESSEIFALDSPEIKLLRSHSAHSAQILSDAGVNKTMINVAHYHHVKWDTSLDTSYPDVPYTELLPMTRLAAIVDVYQALTGKRNYRKNWVPGKAVQYLERLKGKEFDETMLANFLKVIGRYPVGSLVRLSTGDLAFVTKVEGQDADRPVVAVVENAAGELLSKNPLADLMSEPDISITEVIDHYEHYNESEDQSYQLFKSLAVI